MENSFELYKLKRELNRSGRKLPFVRPVTNRFNEMVVPSYPEDFTSDNGAKIIVGIYHEQANTGIQIVTGEAAQIPGKRIPMLLCLYSDAVSADIRVGDYTILGRSIYRVTDVANIQHWSTIADISLEVVEDVEV